MSKRVLFLFLYDSAAASAQLSNNPQLTLNQGNQTVVIAKQYLWNSNTKYFYLNNEKDLILLNQTFCHGFGIAMILI